MPIEIKPAKATKKEYAEQPFTINALIGSQFTIEENLGISVCPRIKKVPTKDGKAVYDVVALKVSNGIFEKDLHIFESDWKKLCYALPEGLISLQGVTLKPSRDPNNPLWTKFEYVGISPQNMEGSQYNNGNPVQGAPGQTNEAPTEIGRQVHALVSAMETTGKIGVDINAKVMTTLAESIKPGDALGLIDAAKKEGWIFEQKGIFRVAN